MKRLILFTLTLCVSMLSAMADSHDIPTTAQPTTSDVYNKIGEANLINVTSLSFKPGSTINSYDIMIIRNRMPKLTDLDMSNVSIVANDHEYYTGYHSEDNVLGPYAFFEVNNLVNVVLPKTITEIGSSAFSNCSGLMSVTFPEGAEIETIGMSAFSSCGGLQTINFPEGLKSIGWSAFSSCGSLTSVSFPTSLEYIRSSAFSDCYNLNKVTFLSLDDSNLQEIEGSVFSGCSFSKITLPPRLSRIGSNAFNYCYNLTSINIPSSVQKIESYAFQGCSNLNDIYPETVWPVHIDETTFSTYATAHVHCPNYGNSKTKYYWDTEWNQFLKLQTDGEEGGGGDEGAIGHTTSVCFYIPTDKDFEFANGSARVEGEPDVDLYSGSGLTVEGEETQNLNIVHLMGIGNKNSSIIGNGNISAKKLFFDLALEPNRWHFMSFPYKVRLSDIICKGNWVFRYYDSEARAQSGNGGWKNLPESEQYLYPGRGYIFQTDYYSNDYMGMDPIMTGNYTRDPTISIPIETANLDFSGADKSNAITPYPSAEAANASWNFMGNPYPCYFDLDETDYSGPITVWNGTGYESIRKGDDVYHFRPLEGFFIQKPEGVDAMVFQADGRHTFSQWATIQAGKAGTRSAETRVASSRQLINLSLSDDTYIDKTRVVFNPQSSESYEIGADASKFISANVAQLYSVDSKKVNYSINERPEGEVRLGYVAIKSGEMTISANRMDTPVAIYDKVMDVTFDFNLGAYTFSTEAGTFNDRFLLIKGGNATRIEAVNAEDAADAPVYSLDGKRVKQMKANRVYITEGKKVIKK